ncbi:MAG: hypothetical protein AAF610_02520 [Pseudomonadota bacterium]
MFGSLKAFFGRKDRIEAINVPDTRSAGSDKLSTVPRMGDVFPGVRHLAVNLVISAPDHETEPTMNGRSFGPQALAFFEFRCKNVECRGGGFDIGETIRDAIDAGETQVSGRRVCQGMHGAQRLNHIRCHYELNFKVNVAYHGNDH